MIDAHPPRRSHPDHCAAGPTSEEAAHHAAAARLRFAFSCVRAAQQISLRGEPAIHADRCAEGRPVPPARVPRLSARRVRAIDLPRQRSPRAGRSARSRQGPLSRRRLARTLDAPGGGRSPRRCRRARRAAAFLFSASRRAEAARRHAPGDREGVARTAGISRCMSAATACSIFTTSSRRSRRRW